MSLFRFIPNCIYSTCLNFLLSISIVSISSFTYTRQPLLVAISLGGNKLLITLYFPFNVAYIRISYVFGTLSFIKFNNSSFLFIKVSTFEYKIFKCSLCTVYVKILKLFSYICSVCWSD
jgi:hypothetical protein